jgi:hypothetical protein
LCVRVRVRACRLAMGKGFRFIRFGCESDRGVTVLSRGKKITLPDGNTKSAACIRA